MPIGLLTCVTGVSGSGKSTLINNTLFPLAATALNGASSLEAAAHTSIEIALSCPAPITSSTGWQARTASTVTVQSCARRGTSGLSSTSDAATATTDTSVQRTPATGNGRAAKGT